jgi:hypothetical protein
MVRFIADGKMSRPDTVTTHLGKTTIPPAYMNALEKAKVNPELRLKWMDKMWEWFNEHKFGGRLPKPKFMCQPRFPGAPASVRGMYAGGPGHTAGRLFLADYLFNARSIFILEIFLHELCHEAVWTIDRHRDESGTQGHGPNWQKWMVKVGLDPRRFDPTDNIEYMSTEDARAEEQKLTRWYGKRLPSSYWAELQKVPPNYKGPAILEKAGRTIPGHLSGKSGGKYAFEDGNGGIWKLETLEHVYMPN